MQIKAPKDFWAGLMFIAFGLGFAIVAQNYSMGTAVHMGPGYFPTILGGILALLGLVLVVQGLMTGGAPISTIHLRPLIIVVVALVLFGVLLRPVGLVAATIAMVVTSTLAAGRIKALTLALLSVGLAAFSVAVFYYGLGLPFKIWPWE